MKIQPFKLSVIADRLYSIPYSLFYAYYLFHPVSFFRFLILSHTNKKLLFISPIVNLEALFFFSLPPVSTYPLPALFTTYIFIQIFGANMLTSLLHTKDAQCPHQDALCHPYFLLTQ